MTKIKQFLIYISRRARLKFKREQAQKTGLYFGENLGGKDNHRLLNLVFRAVLVLFITFGAADSCLSAFNIPYDFNFILGVFVLTDILLMLLQFDRTLRLLGYIGITYLLLTYYAQHIDIIRSGLNALTNMAYELVRVKFQLPSVSGFPELAGGRAVTVPTVIVFVGILFMMLMWECCGRSMNLILTAAVSFIASVPALYFGGVPSKKSMFMLGTGWIMIACMKFSGKSEFIFSSKTQSKIYQAANHQIYRRQINGRVTAQLAAFLSVITLSLGSIFGSLITQEVFDSVVPESQLKEFSDFMLKDTMIMWFSTYKNYKVQGRVSAGQLGQYSSVKPDHKPDLEITYIPTTLQRQYLRTFIGTDYTSNGWNTRAGINDRYFANLTANTAKLSDCPHGLMRIKNLGLQSDTPFLPYYTDLNSNTDIVCADDNSMTMPFKPGQSYDVTYYPDPAISVDDSDYKDYIYKNYLDVPDKNRNKIAALCNQQGFDASDPDLNEKIADYFSQNYKYTLSPGLVPWQTDFVNYFLFEHKEGLCVHFATSGVLIYRTLGIPARYAEGYALDYLLDKDEHVFLTEEDPALWYSGDKPLTPSPVSVKVKDHSAHAWVEIYKDGYGWVPVELTPVSYEELGKIEENDEEPDISNRVIDLFIRSSDDDLKNKTAAFDGYTEKISEIIEDMLTLAVILLAFTIIFLVLKVLLRHAKRLSKYTAKNAVSVIEIYGYITSILTYLGKLENTSHKAVGQALSAYTRSPDVITETVERILYSPDTPGKEECETTFIALHNALEKILKDCDLITKIKILTKL